jgi:amidase
VRNGLVGLKPSVGLISRAGIVPESRHQDTPGILALSVHDAALALAVVAGKDTRDPATSAQHAHIPDNYTQFLRTKDALQDATFGLPWQGLWTQSDVQHQMPLLLQVLDKLKAAGATIANETTFKHHAEVFNARGWSWQPFNYFPSVQYRIDTDFFKSVRVLRRPRG